MYNATDSTWTQGPVFVGVLFAGVVLGLLYTVIIAEKQYLKKKLWKNLYDIFFCVTMFCVTWGALYVLSNGKISLYMVLGLALGFYMGIKLFDNMVKTAINKLVSVIKFIKVRLNNFIK